MPVAIIYHDAKLGVPCPDGIAAAWVADRYYRKRGITPTIIGCTYKSRIPDLSQFSEVSIVDFSFDAKVLNKWADDGITVKLIDHHKTALDKLGDISQFSRRLSKPVSVTFDMDECGATLAWKVFFPKEEMPSFLKYVRDRDNWLFELPMTHEIHEAMSSERHRSKKAFDMFDRLLQLTELELIDSLSAIGFELLKPKRAAVNKAASRAVLELIPGTEYVVPVVNCKPEEDRLISDICAKLYDIDYPKALFVACINSSGSYELRSSKRGNFNVSTIAKIHGGGGHYHASGFQLDPVGVQP